jgi:hypothetical protein
MKGFITDRHLAEAELSFPGISAFCASLTAKGCAPRTFLDLVAAFSFGR